jgi:glycolate dehydrogenase iron-sulfur subunit
MSDKNLKPSHQVDCPAEAVDYARFLDCVHCGMCTSSCPTFIALGDENESPRGRIHLMRAVTDGRLEAEGHVEVHLEHCLDCRGCETACPSGVNYGRIIEPFRLTMERANRTTLQKYDWFRQLIMFQLFPYANRIRLAMTPVRWAQKLGLYDLAERIGLFRLIPGRLGRMVTLVAPPIPSGPKLPEFLPAKGRRRAKVAFFVGCVADSMFRHTHWATLRVLQENGCDIVIPRGQGCCGAIRYHAADSDGARVEADRNLEVFDLDSVDAIVVNHAGCGAMMKEYGLHWDDERQEARAAFAAKVRDINEFLDDLGIVPPSGTIDATATYHDACHLGHAQKVTEPPRNILGQIPGLELRPLPESDLCCGSAGTYNINHPELADALGRRKLDNIRSTGARIAIASNAGCLLQIHREVRRSREPITVMHPMDLLDLSYRGEQPKLKE